MSTIINLEKEEKNFHIQNLTGVSNSLIMTAGRIIAWSEHVKDILNIVKRPISFKLEIYEMESLNINSG